MAWGWIAERNSFYGLNILEADQRNLVAESAWYSESIVLEHLNYLNMVFEW